MWTRWRWAFWIIAVPGMLVFWVVAAAYVGWSGPEQDNAVERSHAESYLDTAQDLALSSESLASANRAGGSPGLLAQKTRSLMTQATRWLDALKHRQVRQTGKAAQRAPLFSATLQFTRRLHQFQRLIEDAESTPSLLEDRLEKQIDAVRILLYNLVIRGLSWPGLHDPALELRRAWMHPLSDVNAAARRLLAEAREYQRLQVALGQADNRLAMTVIVLCAVILWAAMSLLAIKVLAPLFGTASPGRVKQRRQRRIKKSRKESDKTL